MPRRASYGHCKPHPLFCAPTPTDLLFMYGWFAALMCAGSCVGAVAWFCILLSRYNFVLGTNALNADPIVFALNFNTSFTYLSSHLSNAARWQAAYMILQPLEFAFCTSAKSMVLLRMIEFALQRDTQSTQQPRRWMMAMKIAIAAVFCGDIVGLIMNVVAANSFLKIPDRFSVALENNSSAVFGNFVQLIFQPVVADFLDGAKGAVYQEFCEVIVLLGIVFMFVVAGILCARRLDNVMRAVSGSSGDASSSAKHLRRQILTTVLAVFFTFLLRTALAIFMAVSNRDSHISSTPECFTRSCQDDCSNKCVRCLALLDVKSCNS
jgi:hypothetical protein